MKTTIPGAARRTTPKRYQVTFKEFCQLVHDGQKADLIDGVIYMASPDNIEANNLYAWLYYVIRGYQKKKKLRGQFNLLRVAYRINDINAPEPDLGYIKANKLARVRKGHIAAAPDLALEIVSPDSIDRDYDKKRSLYEKAGVSEYWIIDPMEQKITLLILNKDGIYREAPPRFGCYWSIVLPGFFLQASWLWEIPLPDEDEVLALILAGNTKAEGAE